MKQENPFIITVYKKPEFFCNRKREIKKLTEAFENNRNVSLFSPRKLGKTGLIHHFFHLLKNKNVNTFYIDLYETENLNQFLQHFSNSVIKTIAPNKGSFIQKVLKIFSRIRPVFSIDDHGSFPNISFTLQSDAEKLSALKEIFELLENQKNPCLLALDEFQQITQYPEKNMEQILRTHIQRLNNCRFIFSGSQRHLLIPMFSDSKKPFYQSADFLTLHEIPAEEYQEFIMEKFNKSGQKLSTQEAVYILNWSKGYTFYTQYLCNKLFSKGFINISKDDIYTTISEIFIERETIYFNYRKLLPLQQYKLLKAIATEGEVIEPTSGYFIKNHDLGTPSTVRKCLIALIEKEMIFETPTKEKTIYRIYDVFLSQWLKKRNNL